MHEVHELLRYFHVCRLCTLPIVLRAFNLAVGYWKRHCTFSSFFENFRGSFAGIFGHEVEGLCILISVWFAKWSQCSIAVSVGYLIDQNKVKVYSIIIQSKFPGQYQITLGWLQASHSLINLFPRWSLMLFWAISWITYWHLLNKDWTVLF